MQTILLALIEVTIHTLLTSARFFALSAFAFISNILRRCFLSMVLGCCVEQITPWSAPPTMTLLVDMTTDVALGEVTPFNTVPRCCKIDLAFLPLLFLICRP